MSTQKSQEDLEFEAKLNKAFYKTSNKNYGALESKCTTLSIQSPRKVKQASMESSLTYLYIHSAFAILRNVQER
jgi:hypothetical protein